MSVATRAAGRRWMMGLRITIALGALVLGRTAPADDSPAADSEAGIGTVNFQIKTLDELDRFIALHTEMAWNVRSMGAEGDIPNTLLEDCNTAQNAERYVFTPQAEATLNSLRAKAGAQTAANDATGLSATLAAATEEARNNISRLAVIQMWQHTCNTVAAQESVLLAVAMKAPEAERAATRARIDPLLQPMRRVLSKVMQAPRVELKDGRAVVPEMRGAYDALMAAYNDERMRLVPFAQETDARNGITPLGRDLQTPCAAPAPSPSSTDKPSLEASSVTQPDFPANARRYGFAGTVQLRAHVLATGCPGRVEIHRSVGYQPLDEVALRWAEGLRFHPVLKNGVPADAWHVFAVTFRLTD